MVDSSAPTVGQQEPQASSVDAPSAYPSLPLRGSRVCIRPLERYDLDRRQAWLDGQAVSAA